MNKRGDITASMWFELGLIVIFAIAVIIFSTALARYLNTTEQGNFESFRNLNEAVTNLLDSEETMCWDHFLITPGTALVGFGKHKEEVLWNVIFKKSSGIGKSVPRPEIKCPRDSSCLLICDVAGFNKVTGNYCDGKNLYDLKIYDDVKDFKLTREKYFPTKANLEGLSDLVYSGEESDLEYFLIVKEGKSGDYTIVLAKPSHVVGLDPIHNFKNCHNLKEITTKDQITQIT